MNTTVLFRRQLTGEIIAVFPLLASSRDGHDVTVFDGAHCGACWQWVVRETRPATPKEYASLHRCLSRAPYSYQLDVKDRAHSSMTPRRLELARSGAH